MADTRPHSGLASVLSGKTKANQVSFRSILHDVNKSVADLSGDKKLRIVRTLKKMQTSPQSVGTREATEALRALDKAGHLTAKFKKNIPGAVARMRAEEPSGQTYADERKETQEKRQQMWALARERRAEANTEEAGGGGLKQQTQVSVTGRAEEKQHGWAKAEEKGWKAVKESEEKEKIESKDDWKNNPVVNPVSD